MEISLSYVIAGLRGISNIHEVDESHADRTAFYAVHIGERMNGGTRLNLEYLMYGALIHDVGRAGIYSWILNKAGQLTEGERGMMEKHPSIGYGLIKPFHIPDVIAMMVLDHHERHDGSGYPNHKTGEQLSIYAEIVAVADTWDALTSDRPYRAAYTQERALSIMNADAAKYNPEVFATFLTWLREGNTHVTSGGTHE